MGSNNSSYIIQECKYSSLEKETAIIPIKTIKNYSCPPATNQITIYDFNKNKNDANFNIKSFFQNNNIISIKKISLDTKQYLLLSCNINKELFLIQDHNNLKQIENPLVKFLQNEKIEKFIILDNKNIVAVIRGDKLSFYIYKDEKYNKFFNNLNKYNFLINEIIKLENNRYIYTQRSAALDQGGQRLPYPAGVGKGSFSEKMIIILFNEDFTSKEKSINIEKPIDIVRNDKLFKIKDNKVIIIGKTGFVIFDLNTFEEQTYFDVGLIYCVLPFNNIDKDYYDYFALIFYDNEQFFLKIFSLVSGDFIGETQRINLAKYFPELEILKSENISVIGKNLFFDMFYDSNNDGKVILIISLFLSLEINKLTIMLDIDIKNLEFI